MIRIFFLLVYSLLVFEFSYAQDLDPGQGIMSYGATYQRFTTGPDYLHSRDIERDKASDPWLKLINPIPIVAIKPFYYTGIFCINSLKVRTEPIYLVDGVPSQTNPLNTLKPEDIDRIELLKDDDALCIFGSRGAAGAVFITTKKGKHKKKASWIR